MAGLGWNYRKLWVADGLSNVADGVFQIALPLLALQITRSPAAIAGLAFASRVPWLVLGIVAGAMTDRVDRRITMVRVDAVRVALIGTLALLAMALDSMWILYALALLLGACETLFDTSSSALLPSIVGADDLTRANSRLYGVEMVANQFVGPPLGGLLAGIAMWSAFGTPAAAYALAAIVLMTIRGSFDPRPPGTSPSRMTQDIAEGLRFLAGHRLLRTLALMVGISLFASTATMSLLPLFAVEPGPLGLTAFQFGLLLTSAALGSLACSLVAERVEARLGRQRVLLVCIVTDAAAIAVLAVGIVPVAACVGFALGFSQVLWQVVTVSLRQRVVPNRLMGRVSGAYRTVVFGSMALGAAAGGGLAELVGIRAVFVAGGAATLLLLLLLPFVTDRAMEEAERAAAAAA